VGALPVFADVEPRTWTIDPDQARRLLTVRTRAIIAVDVLGHPCDYEVLATLGVPIIEDAAEAHGAEYRGMLTGTFGLLAIFSFHANKTITTGEGGCVLTDDPELARRVRLLANHGMSAERPYRHELVGHNFRMTNVAAAIGYGQMSRWDELIERRRRVAAEYDAALAGLPLQRRPVAPWVRESCWLYTVAAENRDVWLSGLRVAGIDARAIWPALPDLPLFREGARAECPVARDVCARAFWLPTYADLTAADIGGIAVTCREIASRS
jgi:perosamine synthetase